MTSSIRGNNSEIILCDNFIRKLGLTLKLQNMFTQIYFLVWPFESGNKKHFL